VGRRGRRRKLIAREEGMRILEDRLLPEPATAYQASIKGQIDTVDIRLIRT